MYSLEENNKIEGYMSNKDLIWLNTIAQQMDSIVEIGSWMGKSTFALLSGCTGTVYAVDRFKGSVGNRVLEKQAAELDVHSIFLKNVGHFPNLKVHVLDSREALALFKKKSVDMVFIDGDHRYAEVVFDIKNWLPKCKKMICGHDFKHAPVRRAVEEQFAQIFKWSGDNIWYKEL